MKTIGIIGPTDLTKLSFLLGKPLDFLLERAALAGEILAKNGCQLLVNAEDGSLLFEVAKAYKEHGGKWLVIFTPRRGSPWPVAETGAHRAIADEVQEVADWFRANHAVVSQPSLVVCMGLSAGTFSELAYIKWDDQFRRGNLQKLVAILELLRGGELPPELAINIAPLVEYITVVEELDQVLKKTQCDKESSSV